MDISRETATQIVVSVVAVVAFVVGVVFIGTSYGGPVDFSQEGAVLLVGAIAAFVVGMSVLGYVVIGRQS
jgi:formate-dependent nitrite reductase membrane component NrfD